MNEQLRPANERDLEYLEALRKLPLYYQHLGAACTELGLSAEFRRLVEGGCDFGQAFATICSDIQRETQLDSMEEVHEWLRTRFGIDLLQDDVTDIDDTRPKW